MGNNGFNLDSGVIPIDQQIQCVAREINMRERCYPRWVQQGRIKEAEAQRELERMRAVLHTLQEMAGRRIRAFRTDAQGITSVVYAASAGRARSVTVRAANDAGFSVRYADVLVRRAPEFDQCRWRCSSQDRPAGELRWTPVPHETCLNPDVLHTLQEVAGR